MREHHLKITLSGDELARLEELKPSRVSRPAFMRSLLREPPRDDEVATRARPSASSPALPATGEWLRHRA